MHDGTKCSLQIRFTKNSLKTTRLAKTMEYKIGLKL